MLARLSRLLRLDPDETRLGLILGGLFFSITSSYTLAKTARDTLFLARLPADLLAFVYLGSGVITVAAAWLFSRIARHRSSAALLETSSWISALVLAVFAFVSTFRWPGVPIVIYLWVNVYGLILLSQFWAFSTSVSNPRQAKRTLGLIGTLGILGGLVAGVLTVPFVHLGGPAILLAGAAVLTVACVPFTRTRLRRDEREESEPTSTQNVNPLGLPYVRWLMAAAVCSVLVSAVLDYQFKLAVQARSTDPAAIGSFFGRFQIAVNLAALVLQLLFTRWALHRLGATWTALLLPAGLMLGASFTLVRVTFQTIVGTRLWDQVLRNSTNRSATELFYFPLPPDMRKRLRAWIEAGLDRGGDAIAGVVLLGLRWTMGSDPHSISLLTAILVAVWLVSWVGMRSGYVAELGRNVRRMNLDLKSSRVSLREASMLGQMVKLLRSPYERLALYGLEMLEQNAPERIERYLVELLDHPTAAVRAKAVEIAASRRLEALRTRLDTLTNDPSMQVKFQVMRARVVFGEGDPLETLGSYVNSTDPEVGRFALNCIAELAPADRARELRVLFELLLHEGGEAAQLRVAEAIGYRRSDGVLHDLLPPLLQSRSMDVRRASLLSAGQAGIRSVVPRLIEALGDRSTGAAALAGLTAFGDRLVGTMGDYLSDRSVPVEIRRELPRALRQIATADAAAALLRYRERDDVRLGYRVLKALNRIRSMDRSIAFARHLVVEDLEYDVRSHLYAMVHYRACPLGAPRSAERLLCIALNERMDQSLNRIFRRLALLYPPRTILASYRGVLSEDPRTRGNALEYLENALEPEHAAVVLPLVDDEGEQRRLALAESRFGLRLRGFQESLEDLLIGDDPWLRSCAIYVAGARREVSLRARIETNLVGAQQVVRETAEWALRALGPA